MAEWADRNWAVADDLSLRAGAPLLALTARQCVGRLYALLLDTHTDPFDPEPRAKLAADLDWRDDPADARAADVAARRAASAAGVGNVDAMFDRLAQARRDAGLPVPT